MEILEWFDETGEEMVHRLPPEGSLDIKLGAQLVVRESQQAIFYNGGQPKDRFGAGRHTLSSKNLPLITQALSLPWGFKSPFRCEVYFVNRKTFTNLKWGTREPVIFRDARLGHVRLRAYGQVSFRIHEAESFINQLVGTRGSFYTHDATDYLRDVIIARLNDYLGENLTSVFDLPAIYDEMGEAMDDKLQGDFNKYGLELEDFFITAITPPEEIQAMVDSQGGMSLMRDLPSYMQYQMAKTIGGGPGDGSVATADRARSFVDAGVGVGLGMMMPGVMAQANAQAARTRPCASCGATVPVAPFCSSCGARLQALEAAGGPCASCGSPLAAGARFCSECGHEVAPQDGEAPSED
jgi:membrane protease subunit (stomatin/prohibitin family)